MNDPQVPVLPGETSDATAPVPEVRSVRVSPTRARRFAEKGYAGRFTIAKGYTSIVSERRQYRKLVTRQFPRLRSGRQWVKFRKALKRQGNLDYFTLPSYRTA